MALYQPTNVTPSMLGALGNGVVDVTKGIGVSWQVDGQSPMTAFQIRILENTSASRVLYDTGKKTDGCPFYGRNEKGDVVFFRYSITESVLSTAGVTNGNNYKMLITQWWSDTQSVTQQSASVFQCRDTPTLWIGDAVSPGTYVPQNKTVGEFTATYYQAQGDELVWVRWRLWRHGSSRDTLLADTGNVPTSVLKFRYDGFFNGETYQLRCDGETVSGVSVSAVRLLNCAYDVAGFSGTVKTCVDRKSSSVLVSWPEAAQINATATGGYSISGQRLTLDENASVSWMSPASVAWNPPVGLVWRGSVQELPKSVFTLTMQNGNAGDGTAPTFAVEATVHPYKVAFVCDGVEIGYAAATITPYDELTLVLSGKNLYLRRVYYEGVFPDESRYPESNLYPGMATPIVEWYSGEVNLPSGTIKSLSLLGQQECEYFWLLKSGVPDDVRQLLMNDPQYEPSFDENTWFLANFENGLEGGNIQTDAVIAHWDIYRMSEDDQVFSLITRINNSLKNQILDCAAVSQHTYSYYVFGATADNEIVTQALKSKPVTVCLWDWTLLVCQENAEHEYSFGGDVLGYVVEDLFRFSLNVESGAIGNNNAPTLLANFTRYPTVQQTSQRYMSGTLSGYLGDVDADGNYRDTLDRRDALFALAQSDKALFLKNRKGDLLRITISGQISVKTQDATRQQALICSVPWAETGDVKNTSIFIRKGDALWDM